MSHDFLSGDAGDVTDLRRRLKRSAGEIAYEALDRATLVSRRADRLARAQAGRRVLVIGVYRPASLYSERSPSSAPSAREARAGQARP